MQAGRCLRRVTIPFRFRMSHEARTQAAPGRRVTQWSATRPFVPSPAAMTKASDEELPDDDGKAQTLGPVCHPKTSDEKAAASMRKSAEKGSWRIQKVFPDATGGTYIAEPLKPDRSQNSRAKGGFWLREQPVARKELPRAFCLLASHARGYENDDDGESAWGSCGQCIEG